MKKTKLKHEFYDSLNDESDEQLNEAEPSFKLKLIDVAIKEYEELLNNIDLDINHIITKLSEIQKYIITLEIIITGLETELLNEQDPRKKVYLSKTLLIYIEKITIIQDSYHRFLSLKQNYRSEQNRIITNKTKLRIDVEIKSKEENIGQLASMTQLIKIFKGIYNNKPDQYINEIKEELDQDEYSMD